MTISKPPRCVPDLGRDIHLITKCRCCKTSLLQEAESQYADANPKSESIGAPVSDQLPQPSINGKFKLW